MARDKLQLDGIFADGYGVIPKAVMKSTKISACAKAVYAYFCAFAGQGDTCFPSQDAIRRDLGISRDSLAKYLRELNQCGYLITEQIKESGRFSHNVYKLPREIRESPCTEFSDTELPYTEIADAENTVSDNSDANKNIFNKEQVINKKHTEDIPASGKHRYGYYENVLLSDKDFAKLTEEFPLDYRERIERLSEYIASKGAKYKDHLATIRSWARRDKEKSTPAQPTKYTEQDFLFGMENL